MSVFRKNPAAARDKAITDVAKLERVNSEHRERRAQLLLDADDVSSITSVDAAIAANERALAILRERIEALTGEALRHERDLAEKTRQDAISNIIAPRLAKVEKAAAETERFFARFAESYAALLLATKEVGTDWPNVVPRPRHAFYFSISEVERRLATAMQRGQFNGPADAAKVAAGIAEMVQHATARYIGALRAMPSPESVTEERAA